MAKSPADHIRELTAEVAILRERDATRLRELDRLRDAQREFEADLDQQRDSRQRLELELADLKRQFQDHLAQYQEWDKRRWTLILALLGSVLALACGLTIALVKK